MSDICRVALDAMGGDNAPGEVVKGAVEATKKENDIHVVLVGKEAAIQAELDKYDYSKELIEVVDAADVIETGEPPVMAVRRKKESSLVKAMYLVKEGKADAFVSAGSSGAILVGGQTIVGRIKGVERPPMAPLIPTATGVSLLVDSGGNVDARPSFLVQWAKMGSIYMENILGIKNPRVAIVNIGLEEEKGNALVKETYPLLKACKNINFIGSIEARDIPKGEADVIISFEKLEAARWLEFLKKDGTIITNTQEVEPMPVITGAAAYPENLIEKMQAAGAKVDAKDFLSIAQ